MDDEQQDEIPQDIDDEMRDLLDKLDRDEENIVDHLEGVILPIRDSSPPLTVTPNTDSTIQPGLPLANTLVATDLRSSDDQIQTPQILEETIPIVDLRKQFEQFDVVTDEILQGTRSDRQETQDTIVLLRTEVDKAIAAHKDPARMYVDNLVKALEVKATINQTAVKMMEAKAKLLAATKGGVTIQTNIQTNMGSSAVDPQLTDLLANNELGDDDRF